MRQAGQKLVYGDFIGMTQAAKRGDTDLKRFAPAAEALAAWERQFQRLFPPGSDAGKTKALPAIWTDRSEFQAAGDAFIEASEKLANSARQNDAAAFASQLKLVGERCEACHKKFKAR